MTDPMSDAYWLKVQDERVAELEERLRAVERAITEHRAAIHNAGPVKVRPGYETTAEAKHRADERLWAVLSEQEGASVPRPAEQVSRRSLPMH